ncbi:peptidoglycan DD-metalloendopeptidase family protein [Streptomyces sp. NPDC047981]|uniref:peptidoglycan DD-metalloendopeptidase family protein n=1 Tax=Streptomyces sp. NPDC047981 TaxID=3154610 RepID=UPI003416621E
MPQHNKHRKPRANAARSNAAIAATAVGAAGIAFPLVTGATASAASLSAWDRIAECESSSRWDLPYGDADSTGGLQIQKRTWDDFDGPGITGAEYPYQATKAQQIQIAELILAQQGPNAWACDVKVGSPLAREGAASSAPTATAGREEGSVDVPDSAPQRPVSAIDRGEAVVHHVVPGDTLYKIALRYTHDASADNWRPLYRANEMAIGGDPNTIHPGLSLTIPSQRHASPNTADAPAAPTPQTTPATAAAPATETELSGPSTDPVPAAPAVPATEAETGSGSANPVTAQHVLPVDGTVSQRFGNPSSGYSLGYHTGLDFSAPTGTPVKAVTAGTVVGADSSPSYGINVQIRHDDGTYTLYAHLSLERVGEGDRVAAGDLVGYVGSTGNSSGPHLHFELRTAPAFGAGNFLDPADWLRQHGVTV